MTQLLLTRRDVRPARRRGGHELLGTWWGSKAAKAGQARLGPGRTGRARSGQARPGRGEGEGEGEGEGTPPQRQQGAGQGSVHGHTRGRHRSNMLQHAGREAARVLQLAPDHVERARRTRPRPGEHAPRGRDPARRGERAACASRERNSRAGQRHVARHTSTDRTDPRERSGDEVRARSARGVWSPAGALTAGEDRREHYLRRRWRAASCGAGHGCQRARTVANRQLASTAHLLRGFLEALPRGRLVALVVNGSILSSRSE